MTQRHIMAMARHFHVHRCWHRLSMWNRDGEYTGTGLGWLARSGNTGITSGWLASWQCPLPSVPPPIPLDIGAPPNLWHKILHLKLKSTVEDLANRGDSNNFHYLLLVRRKSIPSHFLIDRSDLIYWSNSIVFFFPWKMKSFLVRTEIEQPFKHQQVRQVSFDIVCLYKTWRPLESVNKGDIY